MNRRSLFAKLGAAAAAVAVGPAMSVQAEPACVECDLLRSRPVPLPDVYKPDQAMTDAVIELTHATALREGISHHAAAAFLYPRLFQTWTIEPHVDPEAFFAADGEPFEIKPLSIMQHPGTILPGMQTPLLAMQADCRMRGCSLVQEGPMTWRHFGVNPATDVAVLETWPGGSYASINAWRRSLHDA